MAHLTHRIGRLFAYNADLVSFTAHIWGATRDDLYLGDSAQLREILLEIL